MSRSRAGRGARSPSLNRPSRRGRPARLGVVALPVLIAGCSSDHGVLAPHGDGASRISAIGWFMLATSACIAFAFLGLLVWALVRGGRRPSWRGENGLVIGGGIVLPLVVIAALTVFTLNALNDPSRPGAEHIDVIGHQFWWEVRYPDDDVITANELRLPVDREVELTLTSADVIHSFWVPGLDGKIDLVPGHTNHLTITARDVGTYRGQCAEYCGIQHAWMTFSVEVTDAVDYQRWLDARAAPARAPETESERAGQAAFRQLPCASCHAIRGTEADGDIGPDLTHLASRGTLGAGVVPNDRGHLAGWIANSQTIKPGNLMPPIPMEPAQLQSLLDYLESLR